MPAATTPKLPQTIHCDSGTCDRSAGRSGHRDRQLRLPSDDLGLGKHVDQPGLCGGHARDGRSRRPARSVSSRWAPAVIWDHERVLWATRPWPIAMVASWAMPPCRPWKRWTRRPRISTTRGPVISGATLGIWAPQEFERRTARTDPRLQRPSRTRSTWPASPSPMRQSWPKN